MECTCSLTLLGWIMWGSNIVSLAWLTSLFAFLPSTYRGNIKYTTTCVSCKHLGSKACDLWEPHILRPSFPFKISKTLFDTFFLFSPLRTFLWTVLQVYNARKGGIQGSHSILPSPLWHLTEREFHTKTYALLQKQKISSSHLLSFRGVGWRIPPCIFFSC